MQAQTIQSSRLREMLAAINLEKRKKRDERIEVFNRLNDKFNEWVDECKEIAFVADRGDKHHHNSVNIEVIEFNDGLWTYGYSVQLSDRGLGSGINAINHMCRSRQDALAEAAVHVMIYLLEQRIRTDVPSTVHLQLTKLIKQVMDLILGPSRQQATAKLF